MRKAIVGRRDNAHGLADVADPEGEASDAPRQPADVVRRGDLFFADCPACPWEGGDRFLHFDAVLDSVQHNGSVHDAFGPGAVGPGDDEAAFLFGIGGRTSDAA